MTPCDPMTVAVDWLDAYRAARIDQMIALYSPDAVIDCACGGNKTIFSDEGIAAYWRRRFNESPALLLRLRACFHRGVGVSGLSCQQSLRSAALVRRWFEQIAHCLLLFRVRGACLIGQNKQKGQTCRTC